MAKTKKTLTKQQKKFKEALKKCVEDLSWYGNELRVVRVEFPTKDTFHVHIQEDWSSNCHVRGEFYEGTLNIIRTYNQMTIDAFKGLMDFLNDYDEEDY